MAKLACGTFLVWLRGRCAEYRGVRSVVGCRGNGGIKTVAAYVMP